MPVAFLLCTPRCCHTPAPLWHLQELFVVRDLCPQLAEGEQAGGTEQGRGCWGWFALFVSSGANVPQSPVEKHSRGKSRHILPRIPQHKAEHLQAASQRAQSSSIPRWQSGNATRIGLGLLFVSGIWFELSAVLTPTKAMEQTVWQFDFIYILVRAFCWPPWRPCSLCWDSCLAGLTGHGAKRAAPINCTVITSSVLKSHMLLN